MAKHGVYFQRDNLIGRLATIRSGVSTVDIDGGALIVVGDVNATDKELYSVTLAEADSTGLIAIAKSPDEHLVDQNGVLSIGVSADDRNYYNIKGRPFNFVYPELNLSHGIHMANVKGTTEPEKGDFMEMADDGEYEIKSSQTAGALCFVVEDIIEQSYGLNGYADDKEKVFILRCIAI